MLKNLKRLGALSALALAAISALTGAQATAVADGYDGLAAHAPSARQVENGATYAPAKPASPVTTMGVGWHNEVRVARTLYQCPAFFCNQGQALPGNDLAEVCTLHLNGVTWGLVFNRANLHTGFIPISQLIYSDPPTNCLNVGQANNPVVRDHLYQCPAFFCNKGWAEQGDYLRVICEFVANGSRWSWVYNATNTHEGFHPYILVSDAPDC